jgi:hypothetical protein
MLHISGEDNLTRMIFLLFAVILLQTFISATELPSTESVQISDAIQSVLLFNAQSLPKEWMPEWRVGECWTVYYFYDRGCTMGFRMSEWHPLRWDGPHEINFHISCIDQFRNRPCWIIDTTITQYEKKFYERITVDKNTGRICRITRIFPDSPIQKVEDCPPESSFLTFFCSSTDAFPSFPLTVGTTTVNDSLSSKIIQNTSIIAAPVWHKTLFKKQMATFPEFSALIYLLRVVSDSFFSVRSPKEESETRSSSHLDFAWTLYRSTKSSSAWKVLLLQIVNGPCFSVRLCRGKCGASLLWHPAFPWYLYCETESARYFLVEVSK